MKNFFTKIIIIFLVIFNNISYCAEALRPFAGPLLLKILDKQKNFKSKSEQETNQNKENLDTVIVEDEVKHQLKIILEFLRNPNKFISIGAKLPRGIIFYGPPGTGKTSLGRALAHEANCNFYYLAGSEIDDKWVGTGSEKIKAIFDLAKKNYPAIIFIDEIDTIAKKRIDLESRFHSQTLQQLLIEMDGFRKENKPVIVIATTNRMEQLDEAILRSGRFDLHLAIKNPSLQNRKKILLNKLKNIKLAKNVAIDDLNKMCARMDNFSGADIENFVNKATLQSAMLNKTEVDLTDLRKAFQDLKKQKSN